MDAPTSVVAAVSLSVAAGKNPWIPLGLVFLLAAPASVPEIFIDPELHASLHDLGPAHLLYGLAAFFCAVAILESLADKISIVEAWLLPVSTAWRPFAAAAVSALLGYATLTSTGEASVLTGETAWLGSIPGVVRADANYWLAGGLFAGTIALGVVFGWLSTIGKVGTRLLLTVVPVPGIKVMHSSMDDLFAIGASIAGFAFGDSRLFMVLLGLYLLVGLWTGPFLARLTGIHFRIGLMLFRKMRARVKGTVPAKVRVPAWVTKALTKKGIDLDSAVLLPAYAKKAPSIGRFRGGFVAFSDNGVHFATKVRLRRRVLSFAREDLQRIGLAETTTARALVLNSMTVRDGDTAIPTQNEPLVLHLFPMPKEEVVPIIDDGVLALALDRVRPDSLSARNAAPRVEAADGGSNARFVLAKDAGSLRTQAMLTIAAAVGVGVLTAGLVIPIGAGYLLSPFKLRALVALSITAYLTLTVLGTMGMAWPAALLYSVVMNALVLRDLGRAALSARLLGYVDRSTFMPVVAGQVWVAPEYLLSPGDRLAKDSEGLVTDGSWRAVIELLKTPDYSMVNS